MGGGMNSVFVIKFIWHTGSVKDNPIIILQREERELPVINGGGGPLYSPIVDQFHQ